MQSNGKGRMQDIYGRVKLVVVTVSMAVAIATAQGQEKIDLERVGWTPLHKSVEEGDVEKVKALLVGGHDVDERISAKEELKRLEGKIKDLELISPVTKMDNIISMKEGGMVNLKGKKIANLYHESSYGKQTISILDKQAEMHGFEIRHFPVPYPGLDQKATWLEIARRYKPDWVILRGWGAMKRTALKEASRVDFPTTKIVGVRERGTKIELSKSLLEKFKIQSLTMIELSRSLFMIRMWEGATALHIASDEGYEEVIKVLLEKEANVKAETEMGLQPLDFAAIQNRASVIRILAESGASVHTRSSMGVSALHWAVMGGAMQAAQELLKRGAEINAMTDDGVTAMDIALGIEGHYFLQEILRQYGGRCAKNCSISPDFSHQ